MKQILCTIALLAACLQAAAFGPDNPVSIYVNAGMGTRLGKAGGSTELDRQHAQKLGQGFSAQLEMVLSSPSIFTGGLIVNDYHANATDRVVVTYSDGSQKTGDMTDVMDIWLFAPATYIRTALLEGRLGTSLGVGLGVMGLRNKGVLVDYSVLKSGWCMGGVTSAHVEYRLNQKLSFGITTNLVVGELTSYKTKELSSGNVQKTSNASEAISHVDAMLSVAFTF